MLMIDYRSGSALLASQPSISHLLSSCHTCKGQFPYCSVSGDDSECKGTGKLLFTLPFGDVSFIARGPEDKPIKVGIEIKSYSDFIDAFTSKRLHFQLEGMAHRYQLRFILLHGQIKKNEQSGKINIWTYHSKSRKHYWHENPSYLDYDTLQKLLISPSLINLFIVERLPDFSSIGPWLNCLYSEWTKSWCDHKSMRSLKSQDNSDIQSFLNSGRFGDQPSLGLVSTPTSKEFRQVMLTAQTYPGISYERALACANRWPSVYEMVTASLEEWSSLEVVTRKGKTMRLGPANARRVLEAIHGGKIGGVSHHLEQKIDNKIEKRVDDKVDILA
jgi:hypothetical protein